MRKQYFFRKSDRGLLAWDVDRLVELTRELPRKTVPISDVRELGERWLGGDGEPTWRAMLEHMLLIAEADLKYPIILSANGEVMDGRHRIAKAELQGHSDILAVQFAEDPDPDYVGKGPDELPYDESP